MATDWEIIKFEYLKGADFAELEKKFRIKPATLRQRASRQKWQKERQELSQNVTKTATIALIETKAAILAKFNEDDLRVARGLRVKAANMLMKVKKPADVRALAAALESAQKIGRLALGASTENSSMSIAPSGLDHFYGRD